MKKTQDNSSYVDPILIEEGFFKDAKEHDNLLDKIGKALDREIQLLKNKRNKKGVTAM